jgi:hypothetical protein
LTDNGSLLAEHERYRTVTKSRESANAIAELAKRSMAASSYSLPIDNIRARTMMTG